MTGTAPPRDEPAGGWTPAAERPLGLYQLLDPIVHADPYPLYRRLRETDPVHWDPFLHAWVVTRHEDVMRVLLDYSADRTPKPEQLASLGLESLGPVAETMTRQMLYLDPPQHTRVRALVARGFTPRRVETLRTHIAEIVDGLIDTVTKRGGFDVIADLALPLPAIVSCEMLGLPVDDWPRLSEWARGFALLLGNFQLDPARATTARSTLDALTAYFRVAVREQDETRRDGVLRALGSASIDGDRLDEDEVVANAILIMVGGLETTTNLIANGLLALLRNPEQWDIVRAEPTLVPGAVEEFLRYESPIQHTARIATRDDDLGGREIRAGQAVIAVLAAANRDPERFTEPDRLEVRRPDSRHLAFGWAGHHCFGAPLARMMGELAFEAFVERIPTVRLAPCELSWRRGAGAFRGLESLPVEI